MKKVLFLLLFVPYFLPAQSVHVESVSTASVDNLGRLYIGLSSGEVLRLDSTLRTEIEYSPDRPSSVTLIDAYNSLRIFVYYVNLQEYVLLDRFLTENSRYSIAEFTTYAPVVAPSQNNNVWIIDNQAFSLIKANPLLHQVSFTVPLEQLLPPGNYSITWLREYQNLLFALDPAHGIFVFDSMGNLLDHIKLEGVRHFSFYNDDLVLTGRNGIVEYDIYTRELTEHSLPGNHTMIFKFGEHSYWLVEENSIRLLQK